VLIEVHPFMFTPEELAERLAGVPFGAALHALDEQGLIERRGELVGASRAAVRATQLACWGADRAASVSRLAPPSPGLRHDRRPRAPSGPPRRRRPAPRR
jgi:hypothetical protein